MDRATEDRLMDEFFTASEMERSGLDEMRAIILRVSGDQDTPGFRTIDDSNILDRLYDEAKRRAGLTETAREQNDAAYANARKTARIGNRLRLSAVGEFILRSTRVHPVLEFILRGGQRV
jgi:hypothetical protein